MRSSPRCAPQVVPSTLLLNYFWTFFGDILEGRGGATGTVPLQNPKVTSQQACLRDAEEGQDGFFGQILCHMVHFASGGVSWVPVLFKRPERWHQKTATIRPSKLPEGAFFMADFTAIFEMHLLAGFLMDFGAALLTDFLPRIF